MCARIDQFVDLCILLGCDYVDPIPKVGPNTALKLIREHGTLEQVVAHIQSDPKHRYTIPKDWPFADARTLFFQPDVLPADDDRCDFRWEAPNIDGLVDFLVRDKGFNEDRVRAGASRLQKNLKSAQQARLEGFFQPLPKSTIQSGGNAATSGGGGTTSSTKRKAEEEKKEKAKKVKKAKNANPKGVS